jgi:large subunit ribosomal protein L10e
MGMRPGRTIKKIERPWTRTSIRVPKKGYVKGVPQMKLHQFEMGTRTGTYDTTLYLVIETATQLREQSIEAARIVAQNFLEKKAGLLNYFFKILVYPHQIIREKPIATGAGADRYSQGMAHAYGKAAGAALRIRENTKIFMLKINKNNLVIAKEALKKAGKKMSTPMKLVIENS